MSSIKLQSNIISIFKNVKSSQPYNITVNDYFQGILSGKWQDYIIKYRNNKITKQQIPGVTASGLFSNRSDSSLQEHSNLLVIDIDGKDQSKDIKLIRNELKEVPELVAAHYSLSGNGLAAYFKIQKNKHNESFEAISKMLANDYNVVVDSSCRNVGRLRFVSYDPDLHLNYGAETWKYFPKKEKEKENNYQYHVFSENDIDYILKQITERGINIATDYHSWLKIGFAFASKFGESGRQYYKLISNFYHEKQKINPDKQYDRCLKSDQLKSSGVSIKSFFYYAKLAGLDITSERTRKIKTIAKIRRKQENTTGSGKIKDGKKDAREFLTEFEGISGNDVDQILEQIWASPSKELDDDDSILNDIEMFLKSNYKMKYNQITSQIEIDGEPINDRAKNSIYIRAKKVVSDKVSRDLITSIIDSDFTPEYNPIMDFIEKHKHIKTEGNIEKLISCIDSDLKLRDPDFIYYFIEKWLISIIASAHGIYSILCLVLTGVEHGTHKTNFFRNLLPDELKWLFAIHQLDGNPNDVGTLMCRKLIILDDEFGGKSKQDARKFKELISKDVFTIRKPYGEYFEDKQRLSVLCGTSNEEHVISDITGNRRIVPIQINNIDEKKYNEIDKTELFIEMYWKYRKSPKGWFLSKDDIKRLNDVCGDSVQTSPEMELPLKYVKKSTKGEVGAEFMSTSEIRSFLERVSGMRLSQQKLAVSLKNIGYEKDRTRKEGTQLRGFWVKKTKFINENNGEDENNDENKNETEITDSLPF